MVHDLQNTTEVGSASTSKTPSGISNDRDIQTTKRNKRKNHRGGRKKKGKMGSKANNQDTFAEGTDIGATMKDGDNIVYADAGDKLTVSQDLPMFYAVKVAEGKGLGVFAIRDLKRGTRIMRERPLIHLPKGNMMYVSAEFAKLSGHEQALYLSLHCRPLGALDAARTSNLRARQGLRASAVALSIEEQVKIMAICETNAFEAGEGSVICSEASRIDHSCLPNVHHCWNDTIGQETVHAVKDIAPGEEILTTYVGVSGDSGERKKQLNRYGFTCDCPACDDSTTFGRASEKRCTRLFHLDQGLAMHSTLPVFSPFGNDRKALNAVLEYAELLRKEGVETMELTRSFREAASFSASIGNLRKACEWAEKALEMTACYAGTDYDGYKMDQETLQDFVIRHDRGRRTR